jgi:hypothetical protein
LTLILRGEYRFKVFENKLLRRKFRPKRKEENAEQRKL